MTVTSDNADQISTITDAVASTPFMGFTYSRFPTGQVSQTVSTGVPNAGTESYQYNQVLALAKVNNLANGFDANQNNVKLVSGQVQSFNSADELTTSGKVTLVGTSSAADAGTTGSLPVTVPVSVTVNDQILVSVVLTGSGTVTGPAGYSVVTSSATGGTIADAKEVVFRHTYANGDPENLTFAFDSSSYAKAASVVVYRGVNPASPVDVVSAASAGGSTSVTAPSLNTTIQGDQLVLLTGAEASGAVTWGLPGTMTTQVSQTAATVSSLIADNGLVAPGATGALPATSSVSGNLVAALVALAPAQTAYVYDARGNRTTATASSGAVATMGYDQANRLEALPSHPPTRPGARYGPETMTGRDLTDECKSISRGLGPAGVGTSFRRSSSLSRADSPSSTAARSSSVSGIVASMRCRLAFASNSWALLDPLGT
jgi:hypothetical protein